MKNKYTVIENAHIVLDQGILWDSMLLIADDRIQCYGSTKDMENKIPTDVLHIDAHGAYVGPGFVDIHVHEGGGYATYFQPKEAAEYFLRHGETTILATPSYDLNFEQFLKAIETVKGNLENTPTIRGLYLEGPYLNPDYGSHSYANPWRGPIDRDQFRALVDAAGSLAKVWTVAPEREGLMPFLEYAREVNPDVVFAVGHSEASPTQIRAMGKYRPKLQTHSMNATGRLPVFGGTRGYGPDEYFMKEPGTYAELISDSLAIHVNPDIQQLLLHNKGVDHTILITDSTVYYEPSPPELAHVKDLNFDAEGTIAGSKMTMDQACKNIMTHTNCGIAQAFLMASRNPARAVGLDHEVGSIEPGKRADLVFVDDRFNVHQVMLGGKVCDFQ